MLLIIHGATVRISLWLTSPLQLCPGPTDRVWDTCPTRGSGHLFIQVAEGPHFLPDSIHVPLLSPFMVSRCSLFHILSMFWISNTCTVQGIQRVQKVQWKVSISAPDTQFCFLEASDVISFLGSLQETFYAYVSISTLYIIYMYVYTVCMYILYMCNNFIYLHIMFMTKLIP